jgi:hypothetical protein
MGGAANFCIDLDFAKYKNDNSLFGGLFPSSHLQQQPIYSPERNITFAPSIESLGSPWPGP